MLVAYKLPVWSDVTSGSKGQRHMENYVMQITTFENYAQKLNAEQCQSELCAFHNRFNLIIPEAICFREIKNPGPEGQDFNV